jgi:hypothetical protein
MKAVRTVVPALRSALPSRLKRLTLALACTGTLLGGTLASFDAAAVLSPWTPFERANEALKVRVEAAWRNYRIPRAPHPDNGDEARYASHINNYAKGLPHDALGVVQGYAYDALLTAIASGKNSDFEAIPLGTPNGAKQRNPQAMYTFYLEGTDPYSLGMPAAPAFASAQQASEAIEVLWQAVTRDVPYTQYDTDPLIAQAAADMSRFSDFRGPKASGSVTPQTLFRGIGQGELSGPYISQFLYKPIPYGGTSIDQKYKVPVAGNDHLTSYAEWLSIQNGGSPSGVTTENYDGTKRHIRNGRDMAQYVLKDFITEPYLSAALIIGSFGSGADMPNSPVKNSLTQANGPLWSTNHVLDALSRVAMLSQSAAWYQKWQVHRRARPEVFFGRVHNHLTGAATYPINPELFDSPALDMTFGAHGTYLLPTATPAGSPLHPSYPAGHALMAGASVTVLKAFFNGAFVIPSPVVPDADGTALLPYAGPALTIEGELNKLASNISLGRDIAGVHYRTDGDLGIKLGEDLAISVLSDLVNTYHEDVTFSFNRFDGTPVVIKKTLH